MPPFRALEELQQILRTITNDDKVPERPRKKLRKGLNILEDMQESFQEHTRSREELIQELRQSKKEEKELIEELKQSKKEEKKSQEELIEELKQSKKEEKKSQEELIEELKQSKKEEKKSQEELIKELKQSKKEEKKFMEKEIRLLCVELSHVKALYATRPLLELGLTRYQMQHQLEESSWTRLSHKFLQHVIFQNDWKLRQWVKTRLNQLNKIFEWNIEGEDDLFLQRLWNLYHNFSEKYHGVSGAGEEFIISGMSPMDTAGAALFACGLCKERCLQDIMIVIDSKDGQRVKIGQDGKLLQK